MATEIHPIPMGIDCCYLLASDRGAVLVDGGTARNDARFPRALENLSFDPRRIGLVVVTHAHWDHFGCLGSVRELTGAEVAAHPVGKTRVERGATIMPPGITPWGHVLAAMVKYMMVPFYRPAAASVDITIQDGMSLEPWGIDGRVLHTPGHSPCSVSVLLEDGSAFVGDLAMNMPPMRRTPGLPVFGEAATELAPSWKKLLDAGARTIYPAHGPSFSAEVMRAAIAV